MIEDSKWALVDSVGVSLTRILKDIETIRTSSVMVYFKLKSVRDDLVNIKDTVNKLKTQLIRESDAKKGGDHLAAGQLKQPE